jgi:hypothetical protein
MCQKGQVRITLIGNSCLQTYCDQYFGLSKLRQKANSYHSTQYFLSYMSFLFHFMFYNADLIGNTHIL